ncbi:Protein phosphatase 1 regulatory subunit 3C-B [Bagarius yarrelli]|uniref:Protein phosphatase 1 regulatory subunit 3C-B n=1 Tax=Bagarius yarrelli TaxID=175774 RepID=A0A556U2M3_BAGYA|nr:Protein phosphatase 1 regulatory subunit 3C-B [Bagarius yarrelli]
MLIDLSMHTGLSRHASLEKLLEMSTFRSHRTVSRPSTYESLRPKSPRSPQSPSSPVINLNSSSPFGTPKKKKRVVFADDKGLPLTAVKIFESDDQNSNVEEPSSPVITQTESPVQSKVPRLRLGFSQPSADLPSFLESLKKTLVRLESCSLIYGSLFGKVRVCNVSPEKAVHIRITYDSWKSHQDFPCTPIQQKNENPETELFVFNVPIPFCPNTQDRLEFYMVFRPGSGNMLLLDNNRGQNYRILVEDEEVQPVEKKPLRPYNFLPVNLRNGSSLYKSPSFSSIISSKNRIKSLIRQENIIPKGYFTPDFNNAVKSILA